MWEKIKRFFKDSETIAWAWFNMLVGAIASLASFIEPEFVRHILTPETFGIYIFINGVATKWLRQRRETDM